MPEFKSFDIAITLDKRYVLKIIVYLESEEDVSILADRWFFDFGEHIEFRTSTDNFHSTGGYSGVRSRVKEDRENGIKAYGIVDRDALFSKKNWEILLETDDEKYKAEFPFGEYIHTLLRWEIENYLFDSLIIEEFLADHERGRKKRSNNVVLDELNQECCNLIFVMGACILLREYGLSIPGAGYCRKLDGEGIRAEVDNLIQQKMKTLSGWEDFFPNICDRLNKFDKKSENNDSRFYSLLRIIDGKRLLERLKAKYKIADNPRFHFARKIREANRVPTEIKEFLSSLN